MTFCHPATVSATTNALAEGLAEQVTVVQVPLRDVVARLCWDTNGEPILYLDPTAPPRELNRALLEVCGVLIFGPEVAASARQVRHLRAVS